MLIVLFLVSHFNFLFVPCGGLSWLPVSFLLHVKYTLSYRIILWRDPDNVPHCQILSSDKAEWWLIPAGSADEDAVSSLTNYGSLHAYEKKKKTKMRPAAHGIYGILV